MNKKLLVLFSTTIILFACGKNDPPEPPPPVITPNPNETTLSPSVYIAGDSFDMSSSYLPFPVYWINGKQVKLPNAGHSSASGIAVSETNVYVSASGGYTGSNVTYWNNGAPVYLSDSTITNPSAKAITLSGSDVYTVGDATHEPLGRRGPIYWKNQDRAVKIAAPYDSEAQSIAVAGNDIYITGSTPKPGTYVSAPCYWKNGTPTYLASPTSTYVSGRVHSICISGNDIHVVGEAGTAMYWKNGIPKELAPATQHSQSVANSIFMVGEDVYIAGAIWGTDRSLHACYWKNGVAVILDPTTSVANGIAVYGGDVYVVGTRGVRTAILWKNGEPSIVGRGRARAIVIKK